MKAFALALVLMLARFAPAARAPAAASAPSALKSAREHLRAGRYDQAIAAARAAGGAGGLTMVGQIERRLGRYEAARRTLEAVVQRYPDAPSLRARLELGLLALDTGDRDHATELLDRFYQDYNAGRIDKNDAGELLCVAI